MTKAATLQSEIEALAGEAAEEAQRAIDEVSFDPGYAAVRLKEAARLASKAARKQTTLDNLDAEGGD